MRIISLILSLTCLMLVCSCAAPYPMNWELGDIEMSFSQPDTPPEIARVKSSGKYSENDAGKFYINSTDEESCNRLISSQMTLLEYLSRKGAPVDKPDPLRFYFSEYDSNCTQTKLLQAGEDTVYYSVGYYDLSSAESYMQVLTTLQLIYGGNVDYGYLYWLSNAIADELKWATDPISEPSHEELAGYAKSNPLYMQLTYPCFVNEYCGDTSNYAKALCLHVYDKVKPSDCLSHPIEAQVESFRKAVREYALGIGAEYTESEYDYGYRSEQFPLTVSAPLFNIYLSKNYEDTFESVYGEDFFESYEKIIETLGYISADFSDCLERYSVADKAEKVDIFFHNSDEFSEAVLTSLGISGTYAGGAMHMRSINNIVHEYCQYIKRLINPDFAFQGITYEGQVFPAWNSIDSRFSLLLYSKKDGEWFREQTGRELETHADMVEFCSMCCVLDGRWILDAYSYSTTVSFAGYVAEKYGEETMIDIFLYPATKFDEYGIDAEALKEEWKAATIEKYGRLLEVEEQ